MSLIPSLFGNHQSLFDPFCTEIWDPFQSFNVTSTGLIPNPQIDWKETPEAHIITADLPGLKKEEVKLEVEEGRVIQIGGERNVEKEDKNDKWHRVERSRGKFIRRFRLPENAKVDHVKASMENGVLTVTIPKDQDVKKPEVEAVQINGN